MPEQPDPVKMNNTDLSRCEAFTNLGCVISRDVGVGQTLATD